MRRPTLRGRALRIACAAALAAGIVPAAAWAGDPNPTADPLEFTEEVKEGNAAESVPEPNAAENEATSPDADDGSSTITNATDAHAKNASEREARATGESTDKEATVTPQNPAAPSTEETAGAAPSAEATAPTYELTLDASTVDVILYRCPVCSSAANADRYHPSASSGDVRYRITSSDGSRLGEYEFTCQIAGITDYLGYEGHGHEGALNLSVSTPGESEATIALMEAETGSVLATAPITINGVVSPEKPTFTPVANPFTVLDKDRYLDIYDIFEGNPSARALLFASHHENNAGELIADFSVSDPTIMCPASLNGWGVRGLKQGTATVTMTLATGEIYTNTVTVKQWSDLDYSQLKFTEKELVLQSGESFGNTHLFSYGITGQEAAGHSFYIATSDDSVLHYPFPKDEPITGDGGGVRLTACKPGTAKLYLYFYNPVTEESILTDTMTVTVKAPDTTAGSTPDSAFSGNIISSGNADDIVKQEKLSLSTDLKPLDTLTADQRAGLLEVVNAAKGEKAIAVDISLVRPDGTAFDEYDDLDGSFTFTVRLKLEGELASLDPSTLRTYRIHENGGMEPITCWVHEGYLYISTNHFSPYAIVGQAKSAGGNGSQGGNGSGSNGSQEDNMTNVSDKGASDSTADAGSKGSAATATSRTLLAQTGDALAPLAAILALGASGAVVAIALARRRLNRR